MWFKDTGVEQTELNLNEEINEKDVRGIDLTGTYNQNDLKIEEKSAKQEKDHYARDLCDGDPDRLLACSFCSGRR